MRKLATLVLLLFAAYAGAQTPATPTPNAVGVAQSWRVHGGDDLAWAQPAFNDSNWSATALPAHIQSGWSWYRLRLDLPAGHAPMALMLVAIPNAFEVYVDGRRVEGMYLRGWLSMAAPRETIVPLPNRAGPIEVALRVHVPDSVVGDYAPLLDVTVGVPAVVSAQADAARTRRLLSFVPSGMINLAITFGSLAILGLFATDRGRREYLWAGLCLFIMGTSNGVWRAVDTAVLPYWANTFYGDPISFLGTAAQIEFTFAFIRRPVSRAWRICEIALLLCILMTAAMVAGIVPVSAYFVTENALFLIPAVGLPILLLARFRQGNAEAGWLILPSLLPAAAVSITGIPTVAEAFGFYSLDFLEHAVSIGPFPFFVTDIADLTFLLAIGIVLFFRFTRASREQARATAELEAARDIQRQLVPAALPATAGYSMEAAYLPAEEVGGDFYQVIGQPGGGSLIVVGDVSGKGLRAAMTGALAIGALRTLAAEDLGPAALLDRLNQQIVATRDSGFITCLCALITGDGSLTVANAGHLSPYRNGEEIELDSGLPLGLTADAAYSETSLQLAPGDTLTLLSDGVVEAQSVTGELFGFERTRTISGQSAHHIAKAAQQFGQQDDITVLTLTFAPAEVLHA